MLIQPGDKVRTTKRHDYLFNKSIEGIVKEIVHIPIARDDCQWQMGAGKSLATIAVLNDGTEINVDWLDRVK